MLLLRLSLRCRSSRDSSVDGKTPLRLLCLTIRSSYGDISPLDREHVSGQRGWCPDHLISNAAVLVLVAAASRLKKQKRSMPQISSEALDVKYEKSMPLL